VDWRRPPSAAAPDGRRSRALLGTVCGGGARSPGRQFAPEDGNYLCHYYYFATILSQPTGEQADFCNRVERERETETDEQKQCMQRASPTDWLRACLLNPSPLIVQVFLQNLLRSTFFPLFLFCFSFSFSFFAPRFSFWLSAFSTFPLFANCCARVTGETPIQLFFSFIFDCAFLLYEVLSLNFVVVPKSCHLEGNKAKQIGTVCGGKRGQNRAKEGKVVGQNPHIVSSVRNS